MRWFHMLRMGIRSLFQSNRLEDYPPEELADRPERGTEHNIARGMDPHEARRAAVGAMQGVDQ